MAQRLSGNKGIKTSAKSVKVRSCQSEVRRVYRSMFWKPKYGTAHSTDYGLRTDDFGLYLSLPINQVLSNQAKLVLAKLFVND